MKRFFRELAARKVDPKGRRWIYVPYDQLTGEIGPLANEEPSEIGIVLVEAPNKAERRPYHKAKLALVLANQRHFALEQAERGIAVRYLVAKDGYAEALTIVLDEQGPLRMMEAAERELRIELDPLVRAGRIEVVEHSGWLSAREDFLEAVGAPPWRMEAFYKHVRQKSGLLMEKGKPIGGKYNFDTENRKRWRGDPRPPEPPRFEVDPIGEEVFALIEERYAHHPGTLDMTTLPSTATDAEHLWQWARSECLPRFGPFEDAMSTQSSGLFHTRISPLLNLHRLLPARVVHEIANDERIPLASREGFVRQILGWREFVRHVHHETDGFRRLASSRKNEPARDPGDGGYARWSGKAWEGSRSIADGGAAPSRLDATEPLPPAYWGTPSGLACLDHVVEGVWREGWSHHITRLMVLSNFATLIGASPRELTDWFWVAYIDAFDWVVEPNVLAMGTFAVGELMTTKPYVSGAAYIHKMSDFCETCAFDPKKDCPFTRLYWAFLARHRDQLGKNPRFAGPVASVRRRAEAERSEDVRVLAVVRETLTKGALLRPESLVRRPR